MRSSWLWVAIIVISTIAVSLVTFVIPATPLRPIIAFWFLFVCPGMVVVRFLRLKEAVTEWTLALALSFSIDALVASILVYTGRWSPTTILIILIGFCLAGTLLQLALLLRSRVHIFSRQSKSFAAASSGGGMQAVSLPTYPEVARLYSGTIQNISTGKITNILLTDIEQQEANIRGRFIRISSDDLLRGRSVNDFFRGTVNSDKQIQYLVTSDKGEPIFSFEGSIQTDGRIVGTCCFAEQSTGKWGNPNPWDVSPGAPTTLKYGYQSLFTKK